MIAIALPMNPVDLAEAPLDPLRIEWPSLPGQSVSAVRRRDTPGGWIPCHMSQDVVLSSAKKTVGGKNAITARLSYCFRLTFLTEFMNIYESILHLNLETPPHICLARGIFFVSSKRGLAGRFKCYPENLTRA